MCNENARKMARQYELCRRIRQWSFGCYGWSGESIKIIKERLEKSGFSVINDGIRTLWNPDDESIEKCVEFGREIANTK